MSFYESDEAVAQYLLFHYGTPEQICPLRPEMRAACGFPERCVREALGRIELTQRARALDLGCAVGRSSFELARHFDAVTGIDFSPRFVAAAGEMQRTGTMTVRVPREGPAQDELRLELPPDLPRKNIRFAQGDACALPADLGTFDFVLMANLVDRLHDPASCLARLPALVNPGGWLAITSPYTWLEDYTPRERWLATEERGTIEGLRAFLGGAFEFREALDVPFLIREHRRKYQWSIAELSLWRRG
jgi:putative 4-mercaptohistidine N1-methyltranferase